MPRIDMNQLDGHSRTWLFGISPALDEPRSRRLLETVDQFLDEWAAHGTPVTSARELLFGSFLAIAVDERSETSGCSIDRMFGLLRQFERDLGVSILDANRVFVRHADGRIEALSRADFRDRGDQHTTVFDTTADRLAEIRNGHWIRKAQDAWPGKLLTA
ncbi:MAG TPA: hypothetical protein VLC46_07415 [Thermoanaerobaculia bacterium]|nr:hypothetical protein [Thermoanaerobaculia bacterium]